MSVISASRDIGSLPVGCLAGFAVLQPVKGLSKAGATIEDAR